MSGFGFSPSDIVAAVKAGSRAVGALKRDGGAQERYLEVHRSLQAHENALDRLNDLVSTKNQMGSSHSIAPAIDELRKQHDARRKKMGKYAQKFDPQSSKKLKKRLVQSLRWEFAGEQEFRDSLTRSEPAMHATEIEATV